MKYVIFGLLISVVSYAYPVVVTPVVPIRPIEVKPVYKNLKLKPRISNRQLLVRAVSVASESSAGLALTEWKPVEKRLLASTVGFLRKGRINRAKTSWGELIRNFGSRREHVDINSLLHLVLKKAYLDTRKDLGFYSQRVEYLDQQKALVSEQLEKLRKLRRHCPSGCGLLSSSVLANELKQWEGKLSEIGDNQQLANIDLQNAMQKCNHLIQLMSNVSKSMHDAAMGVVRKVG